MPEDNQLSWRGRWTGPDTFSAEFQFLGEPTTWKLAITFAGPGIEIVISGPPPKNTRASFTGKAA